MRSRKWFHNGGNRRTEKKTDICHIRWRRASGIARKEDMAYISFSWIIYHHLQSCTVRLPCRFVHQSHYRINFLQDQLTNIQSNQITQYINLVHFLSHRFNSDHDCHQMDNILLIYQNMSIDVQNFMYNILISQLKLYPDHPFSTHMD